MQMNRRDVLLGFAFLGAGFAVPALAEETGPRLKLRLLETSDIHTAVMDWDYYRAVPDISMGLVRTASLLRTARSEVTNSVLFDNGDLIQGNPLGDYLARPGGLPDGQLHPMVACLNALSVDAATLGNHEFNFGLPFLERSLKGATFPFVLANVDRADGSAFLPKTAVIERTFVDESGARQTLKIGLIGFTPPQIMAWDKGNLDGKLVVADIVETAQKHIPALRAKSDIVIALCHAGMTSAKRQLNEENAALHLAAVPGIDVIFTGHSHRVFPGPDYAHLEGGDIARGALDGVPAVMPGFWGSHLGVIDLDLVRTKDGWRAADFKAEARPIATRVEGKLTSTVPQDQAIKDLIAPVHEATKAWVETPVGTFAKPVDSFFVWTGLDTANAIVHAAQLAYGRKLVADAGLGDLPLLSAAAPFKVGYTPDAFIDIPAGPVALRSIANLYIFANLLVVVKVSGANVIDWLNTSARVFAQVAADATGPVALLDPRVPSYNFDVIAGLTYEIDLTQPVGRANRAVNVRYQDRPIDPKQMFLVVTNNYRSDGGGQFPGLDGSATVLRAPDLNRDAVLEWVRGQAEVTPPDIRPWRFAARSTKAEVEFETSVHAIERLAEVSGLKRVDGARPGYAKVRMTIG
jgi:2',3'-cyclic-nucleotide 2'-phosphodiesterase/3'-nucleotidase